MKILFQGDSITDGGRDRSDCHHLGGGYAYYAAREIQNRHPYLDLEFLNYGLSGRQSGDLVACWQEQCIDCLLYTSTLNMSGHADLMNDFCHLGFNVRRRGADGPY